MLMNNFSITEVKQHDSHCIPKS